MVTRWRAEHIIILIFFASLALAVTGLPYVRYVIYLMPLFSLVLWLMSGAHRPYLFRENLPFVFLSVLSLLSITDWDVNILKKIYFLYVFTVPFVLFDFSRVRVDYRWVAIYLILLGVANGAMRTRYGLGGEFSIEDSRSFLESTFAFPLAMVSLHLLLSRKYFWSIASFMFSILFLKRVAILAFVIGLFISLMPRRVKGIILSPPLLTLSVAGVVVLSILFAQGYFDHYIFQYFDRSPNDLSKGRQVLWESALRATKFDYADFLFWGVGVGKVVTDLQSALHVGRVLLHNDLLSLVLEIGILPFIVFVYLLFNIKYLRGRLFALFLAILFATDNVIIYQHVMFIYLLIQSDIRRQSREVLVRGSTQKDRIQRMRVSAEQGVTG